MVFVIVQQRTRLWRFFHMGNQSGSSPWQRKSILSKIYNKKKTYLETLYTSLCFQSTSIDPKYAWKWDENRKEHYLAIENPPFGYPVLNYKSERVRKEIKSVLTWWTKWDISGFRVFPTTDEDVVETMTYLKDAMDRCYGISYDCKPQ